MPKVVTLLTCMDSGVCLGMPRSYPGTPLPTRTWFPAATGHHLYTRFHCSSVSISSFPLCLFLLSFGLVGLILPRSYLYLFLSLWGAVGWMKWMKMDETEQATSQTHVHQHDSRHHMRGPRPHPSCHLPSSSCSHQSLYSARYSIPQNSASLILSG